MKVHTLPDYSAERYYLLSEIEQKANFIFLDEVENEQQKQVDLPLVVYYVRWRPLIDEDSVVRDRIQDLVRQASRKKDSKEEQAAGETLLIIEAYISHKDKWNTALQLHIDKMYVEISTFFGTKYVIVGVTDSIGGTPALEKCHDLLESVLPGYEVMTYVADFVVARRVELLGHDPTSEPDAQSGIFQILCLPDDEVMEDLHVSLQKKVTSMLSGNGSRKPNIQIATIATSLLVLSLLAIFLSVIAKHAKLI